ncbi:hypothetical protein GOODEAATRI_029421, partial [Goodea atripinnis]
NEEIHGILTDVDPVQCYPRLQLHANGTTAFIGSHLHCGLHGLRELSASFFGYKTLLEFVGRWKTEDEPLPLVQVYLVALLSFAKASPYLSLQCENVPLVIERLSLSFLELLLSLQNLPDDLWQYFKSSVQ